MSTRSTYTINRIHFYRHHDGYPVGAATAIAAAIDYPNQKGGLAAAFIRANADAEFEEVPFNPKDTDTDLEHHYTIKGTRIEHFALYQGASFSEWRLVYSGPLADWLNATLNTTQFIVYCNRVFTEKSLIADLLKEQKLMDRALSIGMLGNAGTCLGLAWKISTVLPESRDFRNFRNCLIDSALQLIGKMGDRDRNAEELFEWIQLYCPGVLWEEVVARSLFSNEEIAA